MTLGQRVTGEKLETSSECPHLPQHHLNNLPRLVSLFNVEFTVKQHYSTV